MRLKPVLILLALVVAVVGITSQLATRNAQASIASFTSTSSSFNSGGSVGLAYLGTDDGIARFSNDYSHRRHRHHDRRGVV